LARRCDGPSSLVGEARADDALIRYERAVPGAPPAGEIAINRCRTAAQLRTVFNSLPDSLRPWLRERYPGVAPSAFETEKARD